VTLVDTLSANALATADQIRIRRDARFTDRDALCELATMGLCRPARYLPPWASDLRSLLALLTYSTFMNKIDPAPFMIVVQKLLENAPIVEFPVQK
jgi:hypothetical protein